MDHSPNYVLKRVTFTVGWNNPKNDELTTATFSESLVQEVDEDLVLEYWEELGGRDVVTGLGKEHVFKIVEEMERWWIVQWVGYSDEEISCEEKHHIARICPLAIVKWRRSLSPRRVRLYHAHLPSF